MYKPSKTPTCISTVSLEFVGKLSSSFPSPTSLVVVVIPHHQPQNSICPKKNQNSNSIQNKSINPNIITNSVHQKNKKKNANSRISPKVCVSLSKQERDKELLGSVATSMLTWNYGCLEGFWRLGLCGCLGKRGGWGNGKNIKQKKMKARV